MKTWKLVSGILSTIFFVVIMFQSCAVGIFNSIEKNGESSGSAGFLCSILILAGGIVSLATRNAENGGAGKALVVLFGLSALIGFCSHGIYQDLIIWSGWAVINAVIALIDVIKKGRNAEPEEQYEEE